MCVAKYKCYTCSFGCFRFHAGLFARILFRKQTNIVARYNSPLSFHFYSLAFPLFIARYSILYTYNIYTIYIYIYIFDSLAFSLSSSLIYTHTGARARARARPRLFIRLQFSSTHFILWHKTRNGRAWKYLYILSDTNNYFRFPFLSLPDPHSLSLSLSLSRTHAQSPIFPCTRRRSCALMNYYL